MGADCTCSKNTVSNKDEIQCNSPNYNEKYNQVKPNYATGTTAGDQSESLSHLHQNQPINIDKTEQSDDEDEPCDQFLNAALQKKKKKIAQVLLPGKQIEENKDNVFFIEKQLDKIQMSFVTKTLKSHFILSQLTNEQINYVLKKMKFCVAKKGDHIFNQGDPSFSYYVIMEGQCKVYIDNQYKKMLQPGSSFGDLGIIYNAPRSASIIVQNDCVLAELNSKTFKKFINDLNSTHEKENRECLENLQFYKSLTQVQKNTLAANCITQIYKVGEIIFNKGDAANAFYIVQDGIVTVLEKKLDLKAGQSVGVNAVIGKMLAIRSNTLLAKTNCVLLSMTRDIIINNLGDSINNILRKNLILKILKESDIWEMYLQQEWLQSLNSIKATSFNKGDIIFGKGNKIDPLTLKIVLKSDARSESHPKQMFYIANSIIQQNKVFKREQIKFQQNFHAIGQTELVQFSLPLQKKKKQVKKVNLGMIQNLRQSKSQSEASASVISSTSYGAALQLKDFVVIRKLRSGNFGKVYACYNKTNKQKYAVKVMDKQRIASLNALSYVIKQEQLLRTIPQHPFLVKYHNKFDEKNLLMLVMQLLEGEDLFDAANSKLPLKFKQYRLLICQIILVLEHLHKNKIIYRDLKPQNIVINQDGYITLVDLGTAKRLTIQNRFKTSTIIGTPHYMAPQVVIGKGYTFVSDWWSLGIMLYEMSTGRLPYGQSIEDPFAVYQQLLKNDLNFPPIMNAVTQQLILKLLQKNMFKRLKNGSGEFKKLQFFNQIDWDKLLNKEYDCNILPLSSSVISRQEIEKIVNRKKLQPALQIFLKDKWDKSN